jgi:hypothetical protein
MEDGESWNLETGNLKCKNSESGGLENGAAILKI